VSRLIIYGGVALCVLVFLSSFVLAQDNRFPCHLAVEFLASAEQKHEPALTVTGGLAGLLAVEHRRNAPVRYELSRPVRTVYLILKDDRSVIVALKIGVMACAPLKFPASEWSLVVARLWGRGA